jgi:hypothetical protein
MIESVRGEVTYVLRDAKTEEIIHQHTQENIITEVFYSKLRDTWQFGFNIVVSSAPMESSRFTYMFPGNGAAGTVTLFPSRIIPAVGVYTKYFPKDGATDQYVQISGRYDAPAIGTSRTINSVGLGARVSTFYGNPTSGPDTDSGLLNYNSGTAINSMAFLKLTSPCIQTDLQVLDVYYRLFFPHTASTSNIPYFMYADRFIASDWVASNYGSYPAGSRTFPFRLPVTKAGDENLTTLPYQSVTALGSTASYFWNIAGSQVLGTLANGKMLDVRNAIYTDTTFGNQAGMMLTTNVFTTNTPTYWSKFNTSTKIQNVIGTGPETTNPLSPAFLDVDNLPGGTGKVYVEGTWNNIGTPSSPGLYYTSELPEYVKVKITNTGAVGTSQYKVIRQKFFGFVPKYSSGINSYYRYQMRVIPALTGSGLRPNGTNPPYDLNKSLIEDVTDAYFSVQQLSSCCRFDDSSIVFVKKNKILLYSVGAGDYWKYNAAYTDIHQVAVMNNKIYVACRNTGLWVIDPYNSLTPTNITGPGGGIDLSKCNGVAKGYGNTVWVVGNNCLASFNGTTWTKYDSTTTPAFTMTGVSDNNWSNIEYLKVDEDSATNQMLLVRKFNATANPTLLGVWWSTDGVASNTGAETAPTSMGRPRVHRGHVGGLGGYWMVLINNQWNRMSFGTTTFSSITNAANFGTNPGPGYLYDYPRNLLPTFQSAVFVKKLDGQVLSYHVDSVAPLGWDGGGVGYYQSNMGYQFQQKTITSANVVAEVYDVTVSGLSVAQQEFTGNSQGGAIYGWYAARSSTQTGYGGGFDMGHNFILCPGIMITINYDTNYDGGSSNPSQHTNISTKITNFGLNYTASGGSMNYTALKEYGWDGSQWVLNNPNGKPTHTAAQPLFDGVTVRFENGASGTSFVNDNFYKFGLCEGLLKDNATRATYNTTLYYYRKVTSGATDLENTVVPTVRSGSTGVLTYDPYACSGGVSINANNEIIFPGQNIRQYAVGDKQLIGDFVLSIDVTNLNAADIKNAACIGVTRRDYMATGLGYFGFICSAGILYYFDNGTTGNIATISAGTTTSLEIRRVGATISLWRNGSNVRTMAGPNIRAADYVLDVIFGVWDHRDTTYLPVTGTRVPKATITSNGSAIYTNMGNPTTKTGMYSSRYNGVDFTTGGASTVTLNGVTVTPKTDGTAPLAGEVTVDSIRGTLYFNSADVGKTVTSSYTYLTS